MKTKPLLFSAPMVLALLAGRKTQTRRILKRRRTPFEAGDLLWVKESWVHCSPKVVRYCATDAIHELRKKTSALFMPAWASRITLEVTAVRTEQLHAISEADAIAEGERGVGEYALLWEKLHGRYSWAANPTVVVITFKAHQINVRDFEKLKEAA